LRSISVQLDFFRLRPGCRRLRICFSIELINPGNIGARDQMSVGIDGHLYRAVAHLLLHVRKAGARLNQMRCVTMAQCVKRDSPQPEYWRARPPSDGEMRQAYSRLR